MKYSFKTVRIYANLYLQKNYPKKVAYKLAWSIVKFNNSFNADQSKQRIQSQYFIIEFFAKKYSKTIVRIGKKIDNSLDNPKFPHHLNYFDVLREEERTAVKANILNLQVISETEAQQRIAELQSQMKQAKIIALPNFSQQTA